MLHDPLLDGPLKRPLDPLGEDDLLAELRALEGLDARGRRVRPRLLRVDDVPDDDDALMPLARHLDFAFQPLPPLVAPPPRPAGPARPLEAGHLAALGRALGVAPDPTLSGVRELRSRDFDLVRTLLEHAQTLPASEARPSPRAGAFFVYTRPVDRSDDLPWRVRKQSVKLILRDARGDYKLKNSRRNLGEPVMRRQTWIGEDGAWRKHEFKLIAPSPRGQVELAPLPVLVHYFRKEAPQTNAPPLSPVSPVDPPALPSPASPVTPVSPISPVSPASPSPEWSVPPAPARLEVQTHAPHVLPAAGGEVLAVLAAPPPPAPLAPVFTAVLAGRRVEAVALTPTVVRFVAPPRAPGRISFVLECVAGELAATSSARAIAYE